MLVVTGASLSLSLLLSLSLSLSASLSSPFPLFPISRKLSLHVCGQLACVWGYGQFVYVCVSVLRVFMCVCSCACGRVHTHTRAHTHTLTLTRVRRFIRRCARGAVLRHSDRTRWVGCPLSAVKWWQPRCGSCVCGRHCRRQRTARPAPAQAQAAQPRQAPCLPLPSPRGGRRLAACAERRLAVRELEGQPLLLAVNVVDVATFIFIFVFFHCFTKFRIVDNKCPPPPLPPGRTIGRLVVPKHSAFQECAAATISNSMSVSRSVSLSPSWSVSDGVRRYLLPVDNYRTWLAGRQPFEKHFDGP